MVGVNLTAIWRGRQQHCRFVHSVASLSTFLPHHVYTCIYLYGFNDLSQCIMKENAPCHQTIMPLHSHTLQNVQLKR